MTSNLLVQSKIVFRLGSTKNIKISHSKRLNFFGSLNSCSCCWSPSCNSRSPKSCSPKSCSSKSCPKASKFNRKNEGYNSNPTNSKCNTEPSNKCPITLDHTVITTSITRVSIPIITFLACIWLQISISTVFLTITTSISYYIISIITLLSHIFITINLPIPTIWCSIITSCSITTVGRLS